MTAPFPPGSVVFVGAGPGAPDLLTVRAVRAIEAADLLVYADSLVHQDVAALARPDAEVIGSSGLTLEQVTARVVDAARAGRLVVRLQSGDPSVYGAMHEQMVLLAQAGVPYSVIPGVSSAFAAAAVLGAELTVPNVSQTVIMTRVPSRTTTVPGVEAVESLAAHGGTMVVFLSVGAIDRVVARLLEAGRAPETPAAVVYRVTWEDEQVIRGTLADIAAKSRAAHLTKQALILVGDAIDPNIIEHAAAERSHLYDPAYTHSFRVAARSAGS
ncbi:MAG: precorrin-4 C(11)-methyltransferase [Chloroflexota bacterium]